MISKIDDVCDVQDLQAVLLPVVGARALGQPLPHLPHPRDGQSYQGIFDA